MLISTAVDDEAEEEDDEGEDGEHDDKFANDARDICTGEREPFSFSSRFSVAAPGDPCSPLPYCCCCCCEPSVRRVAALTLLLFVL